MYVQRRRYLVRIHYAMFICDFSSRLNIMCVLKTSGESILEAKTCALPVRALITFKKAILEREHIVNKYLRQSNKLCEKKKNVFS